MRGVGGKSVIPLPISEKEIGSYLESVFHSRFFAPGQERKEAIAWVGIHFPDWITEAEGEADRMLQEGIGLEPATPRQRWKRILKEKTLSSFSRKSPLRADRNLFSEPADQLLLLGKGYWYTERADYAGPIFSRSDTTFFGAESWIHRSQGPILPPWKGIWLLRFMVGIAPDEEIEKIWHSLVEQASRLSRADGRDTSENGLFLLMMGTLFLEFPEAHFWKSQGISMLERELFRRVGKDGVCRSKNLSDQVELLWIYLQVLLLTRRLNHFTEKVERRIEKMAEFLMAHRDTPLMPRTGARPGLLFQRTGSDGVSEVLGISAVVFEREELKRGDDVFSEGAFFLTGPAGYLFHQEKTASAGGGSVIFEEAGYAVLKDHSSIEKKLVFQSEELPSPMPDEEERPLPFSISAAQPLFLSAPSIRLHPRFEAESSLSASLWGGHRRNGKGKTPFDRFFLGDDFDYVEGSQPLGPGVDRSLNQKRSIFFIKPSYWVVHDIFSGQGDFDADLVFPFSPETKVEGNLSEGFHLTLPDSRAWMVPLGTHLKEIVVQEARGEKRILIRNAGSLPVSLTTVLYPEAGQESFRHDFKLLYFPSAEGGTAFELLNSACTDTIMISPPSGKIALSSMVFEGESLFVRRDYLGEIVRVFALSARSCYWEGKLLFESERPVRFLEFSYRGEVLHVKGEISGPISLYADGVDEVRVNGKRIYFTREKDRLHLHL